MAKRLLFVGELIMDFVGEPGPSLASTRSFRATPGGAAGNAASAAARAGANVALAACVGRDVFGERLLDSLQKAGVDCTSVAVHPTLPTTMAFTMPVDSGQRGFQFVRGADAALTIDTLSDELFANIGAVCGGGVALSAPSARQTTLAALSRSREAGALVTFDVNWRPWLWEEEFSGLRVLGEALALCDLIKCNESELQLLSGSTEPIITAARRLLNRWNRVRTIVVTMGSSGSAWITRTGAVTTPGFPIKEVNSVGAGDAFMGNLLAWWVQEHPGTPPDALRVAEIERGLTRCNAASALAVASQEVMDGMPSIRETEALLAHGRTS